MPVIRYDSEADVLYVEFDGIYSYSEEVDDILIIDRNANNDIVGYRLLDFSNFVLHVELAGKRKKIFKVFGYKICFCY